MNITKNTSTGNRLGMAAIAIMSIALVTIVCLGIRFCYVGEVSQRAFNGSLITFAVGAALLLGATISWRIEKFRRIV